VTQTRTAWQACVVLSGIACTGCMRWWLLSVALQPARSQTTALLGESSPHPGFDEHIGDPRCAEHW